MDKIMNTKIQEKLVQYLDVLENTVKTGHDFVVDQAPLVLQELLLRERILSSAGICLSIVCAVLCVCSARKFAKWLDDEANEPPTCLFIMIVTGFTSLTCAFQNTHNFITCWFTPRVFILEQIKHYL